MPTKQPSWEDLHERFKVKRINHQKAYSFDGARTGMVKQHFFLHCAGIGIHHDNAGPYARLRSSERGNEHAAEQRQIRSDSNRIDYRDEAARAIR
jgi:hypothetical protein